ncbi:MAG TPA: hypothetical protein VI959_02365 [Alphaproteobacteria bacterium]|nr:hypothetical protein [Alphaproteobacteria bacterium]
MTLTKLSVLLSVFFYQSVWGVSSDDESSCDESPSLQFFMEEDFTHPSADPLPPGLSPLFDQRDEIEEDIFLSEEDLYQPIRNTDDSFKEQVNTYLGEVSTEEKIQFPILDEQDALFFSSPTITIENFPLFIDITYESAQKKFSQIIKNETVLGYYDYAFRLMFNQTDFQKNNSSKRFPSPNHSTDIINTRWNKLLEAANKDKNGASQLKVLFNYLIASSLHKEHFNAIDPDFVTTVKDLI